MAGCKVSTAAPGVARIDFMMGFHLHGTKDALLAAKLARPEWFAEGFKRDRRGRALRTVRGDFEGKRFKCVHRARTDDYVLTFYYVGEDLEAREREWAMAHAQRARLVDATATEQRRLADLPKDHEAYRAQMGRTAELIALEVRTLAGEGIGGYRYADGAMEEIESALDALADALALGKTEHSPQRQRAAVNAVRAETAKADTALQAFIAVATAATPRRRG